MHSCLEVYPSLYDRKPIPNFGPRKIIGYIGLNNIKFARKIKNTKVSFDLNRNIDKAILKDQSLDVKLTELIKYLLDNEIRLNFSFESKLENSQFFCYRGLLSIIAYTPYENNEPWKIVAILYKGDIYLCRRKTEEQLQKVKNMTPKEKMFTSWGYKFEQYMLSDTPDSEPNPDLPVDETEEFSLVFSTRLNHHKIVFGAEMDGILCENEVRLPPTQDPESIINYLSSKKFIELKTSRHLEYEKQHRNFWRFKALKWWCQSFFVGIDTILCGFRNDAGIVENLEFYNLEQLKSNSKRFWTPNGCLNFLDTFLSHVKRCLATEIRRKHGDSAVNKLQTIPLMSLMFEWTPGSRVIVNPEYRHENDPILFDWFLDQYGKHRKSVDAQMSSTK